MIAPQRDRFDLPRELCYLNAAYMTPAPKAFAATNDRTAALRQQPWQVTPQDFFTQSEEVRALAARIMACDSDSVALVPSASYAVATAARNLTPEKGSVILTLAEEFPSNYYGWTRLAAEHGATVLAVPGPAEQDWTAALLDQIDRLGSQISLVAIPHVHWSTGAMLDLVAIRKATRAVGAALFLDLTQSLGALPVSLAEIDPDFAVAAGYKWLFGLMHWVICM
ncbi:hypothetical protein JCM17844_19660 [Iodidimonas gelatinilytica]|uniref:Aminotransferase class V domain-containing protein n=1 Tax=Iodidimonas gelatinilytica TaxID=1236966 RepID=A0A5A7N1E4_9PROT|nr:aminotransferase class V-fold PLP-dependent enzyme [Iodidimonas gelatinilytica]GEQ98329.1 hypothetical protein JCM17844_19660 [Iodidimonas gelatinilytica]GER02092.1 hypothetical protein JCM17845_27150 [Iodidimonas gelatinilytica]